MKTPISPTPQAKGFALVVTISLLVLLSVIALGFLSLSAVTLRSGSQDQAQMEARANARLALQIAIGELQKQIGPDQRITANGGILQKDDGSIPASNEIRHPHWTGVWNSWKAGQGETSQHSSIEGVSLNGMSPTYLPGRNDYFRSWLLSLHPDEASDWVTARDLVLDGEAMPAENEDAVLLVGAGSLGKDALPVDYVSARLLDVKASNPSSGSRGRYAWWAGDQAQKARVMGDSYQGNPATTLAQKISRGQAPGSTGTKVVAGLEGLTAEQDRKLESIPSLNTLDVVIAGNPKRPAKENFHSVAVHSEAVIADVREGGLKRDLSALLERKIDPVEFDNYSNEFSLYKFNTKDAWAAGLGATAPQETVPLQDLAAYYQLYDSVSPEAVAQDPLRSSNKRGVRYAADPDLGGVDGIHMLSMDYGLSSRSPVYLSAYSSLYRQPKVVKVQLLASLFAKPLNPLPPGDRSNPPNTHELLIGITPAITFWNPTNLPIIFQKNDNPALSAQMMRFYDSPIQIQIIKRNHRGEIYTASAVSIANLAGINDGNIFNLYWSGIHPIRLEPGEVKTLSLPFSGDLSNLKSIHGYQGHWTQGWAMSSFFMKTDTWYVGHEVQQGWEPESFIHCNNSAGGSVAPNNGSAPTADSPADTRHVVDGRMRFKSADRIQVQVNSVGNGGIGWMQNQSSYQDFCESPLTRNMGLTNWDRHNAQVNTNGVGGFQKGMAGGAATLTTPYRSGSAIIARASTEAGWPFMHFGVLAGVETSEASNAGVAGGRKFANRPFLHSSILHGHPSLAANTGNALYNFGWNWTVNLLNDVYEAPVQVTATGSSYWGGGYTPESGTTHIIQQEIPVVPPISIAALSHAHLGGWSIGDQPEMPYGGNPGQMGHVSALRARHMNRAVGFGGLGPFTLQAIGNSYAHPQLRADQTHTTISRRYNDGSFPETLADHSYLANKALWDEYFFSSITPQRNEVEVFESTEDREAKQVAKEFFGIDSTVDPVPLPNRRIMPYMANMDESELEQLFADKDLFTGGLADKIAAHLMVEGAFNINSTSVEAWKVFLSSLKGKPVAYLDKTASMAGGDPLLATGHSGTPVGQVGLAGGAPFSGSPADPRNANQWTSWRELTDDEIEELAYAMVKQVKLRGPFLSLSEFVNRRLDAGNPTLAVKGALQAALDDDTYPPTDLADADGQNGVAINAAFRATERKLSGAEIASMAPEFPLAAEGPVAYGSSAYIDQADVLRGFAEQLTPRGDTFVIRTYGDSIDASGKVVARAWCEAVVQRLPDYVDMLDSNNPADTSGDALETKHAALTSEVNKTYGRKLQIIGLRWLDASEV